LKSTFEIKYAFARLVAKDECYTIRNLVLNENVLAGRKSLRDPNSSNFELSSGEFLFRMRNVEF
jgi:hypothetical protein